MRILTVVVSYNFMPWVDRCLGSLRASTVPTDVLVVDNASQDGTVQYVRKHYPEVRVVANDSNLGFGQANNIGLGMAVAEGYDAVFLLNQDAWIAEDMFSRILPLVPADSGVGIWSPVHLNGRGDALDGGFATYTRLDSVTSLPVEESVEADFVNAAFWLIPTACLRRVGGFSPLFHHYGEDVDWANRLHRHGLAIRYVPAARACHDRQCRRPSRESFLRSERVWHLAEYANPCYSLSRSFAMGVLAAVKKGLRDAALLRIALGLLLLTPAVLRHRHLSLQSLCYLHP